MTPVELLNVLDTLREEEFERFKWHLQQSAEDRPTITRSALEKANREDTVDLMVQFYTPSNVKEVALKVLEKIKRNDLVQKLSGRVVGDGAQSQEEPNATPSQSENVTPPVDIPQVIINIVENEPNGVSEPALTRALVGHGFDMSNNKGIIKTTIKKMRNKGTLVKTNVVGNGFNLKLNNESKTKKRKSVSKAPRAKQTPTKKPPAAKTPNTAATKKVARKVAKGPKEAKRPPAARKVAKGPKEAKRPPAARKVAKKPKKDPKKGALKVPRAKKAPMKRAATTKVKKAAKKKK